MQFVYIGLPALDSRCFERNFRRTFSKIPYTIGTSVLISPCPRDNTCDWPVTLGLLLDVVGVLSVFDCFQMLSLFCIH